MIEVKTARKQIRSSFVVGVAYETDLATAREVAVAALPGVEGILAEPAPEAVYAALDSSTVDLDVRFWCDARQLEMRRRLGRAIEAVKAVFDAHGIEMPCQVVALQGTTSFAAALRGVAVTPGGSSADGQEGQPVGRPTGAAQRPP